MTQNLRVRLVRLTTLLGGAAFLASLIMTAHAYLHAFGVGLSRSSSSPTLPAVARNGVWFALFALHHSLFARAAVKARITAWVSADLERSLYVWVASLLLGWTIVGWMPVPGRLWHVTGVAALGLGALQIAGVLVTFYAAAQLGIRDLAGLRPPDLSRLRLRRDGLYGFVRHPIYFAWLLMVWPTPSMTGSRLLFASITTAYLVIAVPFEERSLRRQFGPAYDAYRKAVRWRMLPGIY